MKTFMLLTGSGPLVVLTTYHSVAEGGLLQKLAAKGIDKFISFEIPLDLVRSRYGARYEAIANDLRENDDLRVIDYAGDRAFRMFRFDELSQPILYDAETPLTPTPAPVTTIEPVGAQPWPRPVLRTGAATRFNVMIADLVGDDAERTQTRRLERLLERVPGLNIDRIGRALAVDERGDRLESLATAHRTGRAWLRDANADVLVWGGVAPTGNFTRLRFLSAAITPFGDVRTYRPPVDILEVPTVDGNEFAAIICAAALAFVDPATEEQARDLVALLAPAAEEGERLLPSLAQKLPPLARRRAQAAIGMAWTAAGRSAHDADLLEKAGTQLREAIAGMDVNEDREFWAMTRTCSATACACAATSSSATTAWSRAWPPTTRRRRCSPATRCPCTGRWSRTTAAPPCGRWAGAAATASS